jgi:hypothetical protein
LMMSDRIVHSFQTEYNTFFPLPEENVARPDLLWNRFRCASSTSGFTQPTIIRLSTSRRLRIRVSGKIPSVDRRTVSRMFLPTVLNDPKEVLWLFCFTVFQ